MLAKASSTLFLDVWEFADNWVDIRLQQNVVCRPLNILAYPSVNSSQVPSLLQLLPKSLQNNNAPLMYGAEFARAIANTYPAIEIDNNDAKGMERKRNSESLFFEDYRPYSVIVSWMRLLQSMYPSHVEIISIGTSAEGRDMTALRVGAKSTASEISNAPRKTILITGGQHAREWISTTTVNYVAWSLITGYGKMRTITRLLNQFDFVFVPTVNPDGYAYTWEVDRLWRKNRQRTSSRSCVGIDLDRSWGFMWDGAATQGNPCSESYAGETSFEGLESRLLATWAFDEVNQKKTDFVGLFDLHSYSQQILYPYSFSCSHKPPTMEDLEELGEGLAKAVRANRGSRYAVASACQGNVARSPLQGATSLSRMEIGGGSALDWFYHELHVRHAFQIKLRDKGSYGFLLPKHHIIPTGIDILQAVLYFGESLLTSVESASASSTRNDEQTAWVDMVTQNL